MRKKLLKEAGALAEREFLSCAILHKFMPSTRDVDYDRDSIRILVLTENNLGTLRMSRIRGYISYRTEGKFSFIMQMFILEGTKEEKLDNITSIILKLHNNLKTAPLVFLPGPGP